jgi:hypothetical protein
VRPNRDSHGRSAPGGAGPSEQRINREDAHSTPRRPEAVVSRLALDMELLLDIASWAAIVAGAVVLLEMVEWLRSR